MILVISIVINSFQNITLNNGVNSGVLILTILKLAELYNGSRQFEFIIDTL